MYIKILTFPKYFSMYCKYNINMKNKKMYSLRIPLEQIEYLKSVSNENYTTVTQYILDLINKDMKNNNIKLIIEDNE